MHLTIVLGNLPLSVLRNNKRTELSSKHLFSHVDFFKKNSYYLNNEMTLEPSRKTV